MAAHLDPFLLQRLWQRAPATRKDLHVVLELHDSQDVSLPVYGDIFPDVQSAVESSPGATDGTETKSIGSVIVAL